MTPQEVIGWACVVVFILTAIITLLGIIRVINIDNRFLMPLFTALILEIVSISIVSYKSGFLSVDFIKITMPTNALKLNKGQDKIFIVGAYNTSGGNVLSGQIEINGKRSTLSISSPRAGVFNSDITDTSLLSNPSAKIFISVINGNKIVSADSVFITP